MPVYIYQLRGWPSFKWDAKQLLLPTAHTRHKQGKLLGKMEGLGFALRQEASLEVMTFEIIKSSEIEGEVLKRGEVRSSIARRLDMNLPGLVPSDRYVDGVVEMMMDATKNYAKPLTQKRLFGWQAAMFSGGYKIVTGKWRENKTDDPMQVVSGPAGKEKVHFQAPDAAILNQEMKNFLDWFNNENNIDPLLKAALAHLWFVTIHPFDDGNGRIGRAIAEMQLCRADNTSLRFYSMSSQIRKERKVYYTMLEKTQKGPLDITNWISWFLECLNRSFAATGETLGSVTLKAKFWEQHATTILNKRQQLMLNKMLDGFDGKLNTSKWAKITKTSADTALRDIQDLVSKNVLQKEEGGGRSTSYLVK